MRTAIRLLSLTVLPLPTISAQAPSVLELQKSYHVATYSGTIDSPSGDLMLLAGFGDMDLTAAGSMTGALDLLETTVTGPTVTLNDPIAADYYVRPSGELIFDFDPGPGEDLVGLWITTDGSVMHTARQNADPEALTLIAIEKATGLTNASLSGDYYFVSQRMEFDGIDWNTACEWGTATFDGVGGGTFTATSQEATPTGTTTGSGTGAFTYSVAGDGTLDIDGSAGALSADGELLFSVTSEAGSGEVGLLIAVRVGTSYDFNDLSTRHSLIGQGYQLGIGADQPRSTTEYAELTLQAASSSTGTWDVEGVVVDGSPTGLLTNPLFANGTATLSNSGLMTMTDGSGSIELGFSANGTYYVGRVVQDDTNQLFGTRQCGPSFAFGNGTAGTGGIEPSIGMRTFPTIGNNAFFFTVADAIGGGIAAMAVSFASLPGIPALGGTIWIDPTGAYIPLILLDGSLGVAGDGSGQTQVLLPNVTTLIGAELFAQCLVLDPAAPEGFAMTRGFVATICR